MSTYTRRQAAEKGLIKYKSKENCKRNHDSLRYTNSGLCIQCLRDRGKKYQNEIKRLQCTRFKTVKIECHVDDEATLRNFATGLETARELEYIAKTVNCG